MELRTYTKSFPTGGREESRKIWWEGKVKGDEREREDGLKKIREGRKEGREERQEKIWKEGKDRME